MNEITTSKPFKPSAEMTFLTVHDDCIRLHDYCREHTEAVLSLDLSEVSHCDSAGLALLIEAKRKAADKNKSCEFNHMPKVIKAFAEFCGLESILVKI